MMRMMEIMVMSATNLKVLPLSVNLQSRLTTCCDGDTKWFPCIFSISLHAFPYFRAHPSIFSYAAFYISLDIFSYFPARLFIVSVKIGHFSLFWSEDRTPFRFWPSLAHFHGVFWSLTIMQICFQISIVYPPSALSASVCVVAVAGAGLSLQIQSSLKIRATLSSSSPGYFIASFCPASSTEFWAGLVIQNISMNCHVCIVTRSLKVVILNRLGSTDFLAELGGWDFIDNQMA